MPDHGRDGGADVLRTDNDTRVAAGKHAEHLIGKSLSHRSDIAKIQNDFSELFQICHETSRLRTGDIIGLQQLDQDSGLLELEIVLLRSELAEHVFNRLPGAALEGKSRVIA
jgi:hypothetical protein